MSEINLTKEELKILMDKHKDDTLGVWYRSKYTKLWEREPLEIQLDSVSDLKIHSKRVLSCMGFNANTLYPEEAFNILDNISNHIQQLYAKGTDKDTLAVCLITEILDYYNSIYDESYLLDTFGIDKNTYMDTKIYLHEWCKNYYWKPKTT